MPQPLMPAAGARYVALGSSFAAGPGIGHRAPGSPRRAGRSAANYAHLVAQRFGLDLDDVTYSGATTGDILTARPDGWPAQLDAVTADTRLATITCGGNDLGYVPRLVLSSLPWPVRALPAVRRRADADADPELMQTRFGELAGRLAQIAAAVHRRAPGCRLIFVDYLTLLPPDAATATGALPAEVAAWGRGVARRLSEVTRAAAERGAAEGDGECDFAPAGAASKDHHAWSADPWTRRFHLGLRGGAPYHPNAAGMAAVAALVADILTELTGRTGPRRGASAPGYRRLQAQAPRRGVPGRCPARDRASLTSANTPTCPAPGQPTRPLAIPGPARRAGRHRAADPRDEPVRSTWTVARHRAAAGDDTVAAPAAEVIIGIAAAARYLGYRKPDSFRRARTRHPIPGEGKTDDGHQLFRVNVSHVL